MLQNIGKGLWVDPYHVISIQVRKLTEESDYFVELELTSGQNAHIDCGNKKQNAITIADKIGERLNLARQENP